MFRPGRLTSRKTSPYPQRAVVQDGGAVARRPLLFSAPPVRGPRLVEARRYASTYVGKPGLDEPRMPEQPQRQCIAPSLIQARQPSTSAPISSQVSPRQTTTPFDESTQALLRGVYDKLPLDHAKYTRVLDVANDYAVLSRGDNYVLALRCRMFDSETLTFPLHPTDATKILACRDARESHVRDLRANVASRYIFSLEGVDKMRKMFDPDYRPL